tara:strand:- start:478 stop:1101 length:624 start_codon:yes stop_codon:yes gene_type:complete
MLRFSLPGASSMQDSRLYEQILGIESPWSVERVELELEAGEVHVHLLHHKNATWPCPECGTACPLHEHEPTKTWRHLDTCQYRTLLHASVPRTKCAEHGVKVVKVFWAERHSRFTMLFERLAIAWMQEAGRSAVARRMNMSWDQADRIMRQAVERGLARRGQEIHRHIGVDEKSFTGRPHRAVCPPRVVGTGSARDCQSSGDLSAVV